MTGEPEKTTTLDPVSWFEQYGDELYGFALGRTRDQAAAEDLVQETFLAALSASRAFHGKSSEKTWLVGILKHKIYDYYRRNSRNGDLTAEESDTSAYNRLFERDDEWNGHWNQTHAPTEWGEKNSPFQAAAENEFQIILNDCLTGLPERIANAFVMREVDELDAAEICRILRISSGNFWVMMHRARLHLRRCIETKWLANAKPR